MQSSKFMTRLEQYLPVASRILLAIFGSYAVATVVDLACLTMFADPVAAINWGYLLSLVSCAGTIILVFSTATARQAWVIVTITIALFYGIWQLGK